MHGAKSATRCILNTYLYSNGTINDGSSQGCVYCDSMQKMVQAYSGLYRRAAGGLEEKVSVFSELHYSVRSSN